MVQQSTRMLLTRLLVTTFLDFLKYQCLTFETMFVFFFQSKAAELVESQCPSSTSTNPKEDTLAHILGPDNPGRLREMGRGMNMSKLACFQVKNKYMAEMQKNQATLQKQVQDLQDALVKLKNQVSYNIIWPRWTINL